MRASHGGQLVAVGFSYRSTYVLAYSRGDFVVYKLGYFVVSPHVAFATDGTRFFYSLRLFEFSSAILTLSWIYGRYNTYVVTEGFRSCKIRNRVPKRNIYAGRAYFRAGLTWLHGP